MKQDFKKISSQVVEWYLQAGRHNLPWRKKVTPYRIWISEIMLQQTQVKTAIPYFNEFMKKYPTFRKLSSASEDQILAAWSGLGFYRRAKNIFAAKEIIKRDFKNKFLTKGKRIYNDNGKKYILLNMKTDNKFDTFNVIVKNTNKIIFEKNELPKKFLEYIKLD